MANLAPVSARMSPRECQSLEAAAEQSSTNLSDFIRRKTMEAAEIELAHQGRVVIPATEWKKFKAWMDSPPKDVPALAGLAKTCPAWCD